MTNSETAAHIRQWVARPGLTFSWPTDGCGYDQHVAFVSHRNAHWTADRAKEQTFAEFCLEYAASLESAQSEAAVDPVDGASNG